MCSIDFSQVVSLDSENNSLVEVESSAGSKCHFFESVFHQVWMFLVQTYSNEFSSLNLSRFEKLVPALVESKAC